MVGRSGIASRGDDLRAAAVARAGWGYVGGRAGNKPSPAEKAAITMACEKFIAEVLIYPDSAEIRKNLLPTGAEAILLLA